MKYIYSYIELTYVTFLFDIQYGTRYVYRSVTSNVEGRLDYILTSIIKYQQIELKKYNNAIFYLSVPSRYPLADLELENFRIKIRELLGYDNMLFGMAITDSSNMRIKAVLHLILDWSFLLKVAITHTIPWAYATVSYNIDVPSSVCKCHVHKLLSGLFEICH